MPPKYVRVETPISDDLIVAVYNKQSDANHACNITILEDTMEKLTPVPVTNTLTSNTRAIRMWTSLPILLKKIYTRPHLNSDQLYQSLYPIETPIFQLSLPI